MEKNREATGISGLDEITNGGFIRERSYLARGGPGTGKTTLGLHFLTEGITNDEKVLFITLTETEDKIREDAGNRGFNLEGIDFFDLSPSSKYVEDEKDYDIFPSSQVEQKPMIDNILNKVETLKPDRIFFDGVTQLKYLSADSFQYRKQILSFVQFTVNNGATILLSSEASKSAPDDDLQFLVDGVINLEFNHNKRVISITKFRGSGFQSGRHSMELNGRGIKIFPILKPGSYQQKYTVETNSSGIPEIDELLHGGLERGTTTVITGPSGVGKTTLGVQFMKTASGRGERSVVYCFEEGVETLIKRSESINIPLGKMVEKDTLSINKVDPLQYSPDEFTLEVRKEVEEKGARIVMIDSVSGYRISFENVQENGKMVSHLHALSEYLTNMGVTVFLLNEVEDITGNFKATDYGISYMADNIVFLRYLEMKGELRKSIGVLKKRLSDFENSMREFKITNYGIKVGKPLRGLRGILTGNPEFIGNNENGE